MEFIESYLVIAQNYYGLIPFLFFFLLLLAGLNIPISEDAILVAGGILCIEKNFFQTGVMYTMILLGAYLSAWEAFFIGRWLGKRLTAHSFFGRFITKKTISRIKIHFKKHPNKTLFFGRFIPFGFRNALFITAGMGKMPFRLFALLDIPGCILSTAWIFFTTYYIGQNREILAQIFTTYRTVILICFAIGMAFWGIQRFRRRSVLSQ